VIDVVRRRRTAVELVDAVAVSARVDAPKLSSISESRDARIRRETRREFQEARRRYV
jgi:hypothetical protein